MIKLILTLKGKYMWNRICVVARYLMDVVKGMILGLIIGAVFCALGYIIGCLFAIGYGAGYKHIVVSSSDPNNYYRQCPKCKGNRIEAFWSEGHLKYFWCRTCKFGMADGQVRNNYQENKHLQFEDSLDDLEDDEDDLGLPGPLPEIKWIPDIKSEPIKPVEDKENIPVPYMVP